VAQLFSLGQYATMIFATFIPHTGFERGIAATIVIFFVGVGGRDIWLTCRITKYIRDKHPDSKLGVINVRLAGFRRNTKNSLGLHDPELDRMFDSKKRFDNVTGVSFIVILGALLLSYGATR
jgi:hypothetical protein